MENRSLKIFIWAFIIFSIITILSGIFYRLLPKNLLVIIFEGVPVIVIFLSIAFFVFIIKSNLDRIYLSLSIFSLIFSITILLIFIYSRLNLKASDLFFVINNSLFYIFLIMTLLAGIYFLKRKNNFTSERHWIFIGFINSFIIILTANLLFLYYLLFSDRGGGYGNSIFISFFDRIPLGLFPSFFVASLLLGFIFATSFPLRKKALYGFFVLLGVLVYKFLLISISSIFSRGGESGWGLLEIYGIAQYELMSLVLASVIIFLIQFVFGYLRLGEKEEQRNYYVILIILLVINALFKFGLSKHCFENLGPCLF